MIAELRLYPLLSDDVLNERAVLKPAREQILPVLRDGKAEILQKYVIRLLFEILKANIRF